MQYNLKEHRLNFAIWAAARAVQRAWAGANTGCISCALRQSGIIEFIEDSGCFEVDAAGFKKHHQSWCRSIIKYLGSKGIPSATFGRAAKIVAVFLKSAVILGDKSETKLAFVAYPPIDRDELQQLGNSNLGTEDQRKKWKSTAWTKLDEDKFYKLVAELRSALPVKLPFWCLEQYWTVVN